jgi:Holliday junction resolvasome RuvABC DNA-binding subunit
MLPIAGAFLSRILWAIVAFVEAVIPQNKEIQVVEKVVYKNRPQKIVYKDRVKVEYRDRRVWGRDEAPAKNKEKTVTSTPATDPSIVAGAVNGLGSLGISKAEANLLVQKVCSSKAYFDIENLLKDCLSELK